MNIEKNDEFSIKIPESYILRINQESSFENIIGQFQMICSKILCVIDGTRLLIITTQEMIPSNIRFDYKQRRSKLTEYYFRDIENDTLYCVFGRTAAIIFFPRINIIDPSGSDEPITKHLSINNIEEKTMNTEIPPINNNTKENTINTSIPPINNNIKEKIINLLEIKNPIPIEYIPEKKQVNHNLEKNDSKNKNLKIIHNTIEHKTQSLLEQNIQEIWNKIGLKHLTQPIPKDIIIIDKNTHLTFSNKNYNIEIKIHNS